MTCSNGEFSTTLALRSLSATIPAVSYWQSKSNLHCCSCCERVQCLQGLSHSMYLQYRSLFDPVQSTTTMVYQRFESLVKRSSSLSPMRDISRQSMYVYVVHICTLCTLLSVGGQCASEFPCHSLHIMSMDPCMFTGCCVPRSHHIMPLQNHIFRFRCFRKSK